MFGYDTASEFVEQLGTIAYAYERDRDAIGRRLREDGIVTNEEVECAAATAGRSGRFQRPFDRFRPEQPRASCSMS